MFKSVLIPTRAIFAGFTLIAGLAFPAVAVAEARLSETYGKLPLQFEANQGQAPQGVRFLSRGPGYSLYLTAGEAVLVLARPNPEGKQDGRSTPGPRATPTQGRSCSPSKARTNWRSTCEATSCCIRQAETYASTSPSSSRRSTESGGKSMEAT